MRSRGNFSSGEVPMRYPFGVPFKRTDDLPTNHESSNKIKGIQGGIRQKRGGSSP